MVHFIRYDSFILFHSDARCRNLSLRVTPFGYPGIKGYVLLHRAFRSLSRPSSSVSSKASAMDLYSLDHIIFSMWCHFIPVPVIELADTTHTFPSPAMTPFQLSQPSFPSLFHVKDLFCCVSPQQLLGLIRVELMTPSLSEKCSNRLSYSP